jgi:hypothetical protein
VTPEEVRGVLIGLRAVKKCWRCFDMRPIQEFATPTAYYCGGCNSRRRDQERDRRQYPVRAA